MTEYDYLSREVISEYKSKGLSRGFIIEDVRYTGFWSQGDGLSWLGEVDLKKWLETHKEDFSAKNLKKLVCLIENDVIEPYVRVWRNTYNRSHLCYHDKTMDIELTTYEPKKDELLIRGKYDGWLARPIFKKLEPIINNIGKNILEECRDYANSIYKELEKIAWDCLEENDDL